MLISDIQNGQVFVVGSFGASSFFFLMLLKPLMALTTINRQSAVRKNVISALIKLPKLKPGPMPLSAEKPPSGIKNPRIGVKTSLTREVTIEVNAAPIIIPTAKSRTLPFEINSLNSFNIFSLVPP